MARAPFQVLIYPYRRVDQNEFEFAVLRRTDVGWWQGIAGGGEDQETPLQAARREMGEEAGIPPSAPLLPLDTVEPVPVTELPDSYHWPKHLYVIPQYCFGVWVQDARITLSHEHTEYEWLKYAEAYDRVRYDGNRTALWELNQRLRGKGPREK